MAETTKTMDLCPQSGAQELLGLDDTEFAQAVKDGDLRLVRLADPGDAEALVLGADVDKLVGANDPRQLAKAVGRGGGTALTAETRAAVDAVPRL